MRRSALGLFVFLIGLVSMCAARRDAKSLLQEAGARYRESKSFRIEFETKITSSSLYSNGWSKQAYVLARSGQKYHWEQKGSGLRTIRISDGASDWFYRPGVHEYSVQSAGAAPAPQVRGAAGGTAESWVKAAMQSLLHMDDDPEAFEIQREETIVVGSAKVPCYVATATQSMSYRKDTVSTREISFWIDKTTGVVRKSVIVNRGPTSREDEPINQVRTVETVYTRVEFDTPAETALFEFKPPADAYLIDDARQPTASAASAGKPAPTLQISDRAGVFDLAGLRGKVALVQFWASWCGACTEEMKTLAQLPESYADKGLVIVGIDEDEVPEVGDSYLASHHYNWKNLHDAGEVQRRNWGVAAFPFLALVDRDGKVTWTQSGYRTGLMQRLRSELGKPELGLP